MRVNISRQAIRKCLICEKPLPPANKSTCSLQCRDAAMMSRITAQCAHCGTTFTKQASHPKKYCSLSCAATINNSVRQKTGNMKTCQKCGSVFYHKRHDTVGKFCSRRCSDSTNKSVRGDGWTVKQCKMCNTSFECPPYHRSVEHCSVKCAGRRRAQTVNGQNHPLYKPKARMACEVCGKNCEVKPSLVSRFRACSRRCASILGKMTFPRETSIERIMREALRDANLAPTPQYVIGPYVADFAFTAAKLVVECDGDYWHSRPTQIQKDKRRDAYLRKRGWHVMRFSESDIKKSPEQCVNAVLEFLSMNADMSILPI